MKFLLTLFSIIYALAPVCAAELRPEAVAWLRSQTNVQSWSADFIQTRTFRALTQPLMATGHVWFASPNKFRWELGNPPQTIAVRGPTDLQVIYPKLKRVERFDLSGRQSGPWREALTLLEAGFPRSQTDLQARYLVLSQSFSNNVGSLVLQPKASAARAVMPRIKIDFDTASHSLRATELHFADNSSMRTDFLRPEINPLIDARRFTPEIPDDYKQSNPLDKSK